MKRCEICGHPYDGKSTVCVICGNPYTDSPDPDHEQKGDSTASEDSVPVNCSVNEEKVPEKAEEAVTDEQGDTSKEASDQSISLQSEETAVQDGQSRPSDRPQGGAVYGQDRPSDRPQGGAVYGQDRPSGRPRGGTMYGQDRPSGRPREGAMYGQSRPSGRPQERTIYGQNGQGTRPQGRPPYDQNIRGSRPQGRPPYDQNVQGRPQTRASHAPLQGRPNVGGPRQGAYGQRMIQEAKRILHSPIFLLLTVLYTAAIAASAVSAVMQDLNFTQIILMLTEADAPGELMAYTEKVADLFSRFDSGTVVIALISRIPDIFLCLGFWIAYATSGKRSKKVSGAGFLFARIGLILKLIVGCILMLACLLLAVTFAVSAWVADIQATEIASVIFLAAMIVLTMMIVMYFFCCLHTVKVCEWNMVRGEADGKVSVYAAVLTMAASLLSVIMLLSAIVNVEIAGMVSAACSIGWMILTGIWILGYRRKIRNER